jgi:hypothetical protein
MAAANVSALARIFIQCVSVLKNCLRRTACRLLSEDRRKVQKSRPPPRL